MDGATVDPIPPDLSSHAEAATRIARAFAEYPGVQAVAWGGSWMSGAGGAGSDIDLCVYASAEVPLDVRRAIIARFAASDPPPELDNRFFETGDEWADARSGIWIDIVYRSSEWVVGELNRVLDRHDASLGYTTAIWHNVRTSRILFDRSEWLQALVEHAGQPYPEPLRQAIIAKNLPLLAGNHGSYRAQIGAAVRRGDSVSVNHRIAALLASVFDILFAVNRQTHPGEKRLLAFTEALCPLRPLDVTDQIDRIVRHAGDDRSILDLIDALCAEMVLLVASSGGPEGGQDQPIGQGVES